MAELELGWTKSKHKVVVAPFDHPFENPGPCHSVIFLLRLEFSDLVRSNKPLKSPIIIGNIPRLSARSRSLVISHCLEHYVYFVTAFGG